MAMSPQAALEEVFGFSEFRGLQQAVIDTVVDGGDALVLMPTGAGKSLCYQVPALVRPGVAVVVSPLIALMEDQVEGLKQLGVRAVFLNSSMDLDRQREIEQQLLAGEVDLLYVAPERLLSPRCLQLLQQCQSRQGLALIAIDEAHCVSQWGHDFRPEYQRLGQLAEHFPGVPRIALTATADEQTREDMVRNLGLDSARRFISGFDRPNIRYSICLKQRAKEQLLQFIRQHHRQGGRYDAGIVYCLSRKRVEATAEYLQKQGIDALPYHAGLSAELRQHHQRRFIREDGVVIVATVAFGMGIDKPNVRFVAHLDLPKSLEAYYQETGRAGRDGLPANAWMAYGLQDVINLRQMLDGSNAPEVQKRIEQTKLEAMLGLCEVTRCRRQVLLGYFGDELPEPCGNCDNCQSPPESWDATEAAQMALSCVYRTGQRYGVNYQCKVLMGERGEDIERRGHQTLKLFGLGKDLNQAQWRSVFRQLIAHGLLRVDMERWGSLQLTERARPVLRGEERLHLRRDPERERSAPLRQRMANRWQHAGDQRLFEALRELRRELSREQDIAAYRVFNDATLTEMVETRPSNLTEMARINGVGEKKLDTFGSAFLEVIRHQEEVEAAAGGDSVGPERNCVELFRLGMDVAAIAVQSGLSEAAVSKHLAGGVERGEVEIEAITELPRREIDEVQARFLETDPEALPLKPVHQHFAERYDWATLEWIRADLKRQIGAAA
ncbi:MAG: DNA helicase RecQ [Pseudomonadota bacterium]